MTQSFHVGYPKSGSTTIQTLLRASGIPFLGKPYADGDAEYYVREYLSFGDLRQLPREQVANMREKLCAGSPVISDEILSGIGFAHGIAANSLLQILDNLSLLTNGDFIAFVVLRRPASLVRSYFGQLVRMGARMSFDQFCSLVLLRRHRWLFRALDYASLLRSDYYKSGRLRIRLFEDLFSKEHQLAGLLKDLGVSSAPDAPGQVRANTSDTDSFTDILAQDGRDSPADWIHSQVTRPSVQEFGWIERLPLEEQQLHLSLWQSERSDAIQALQLRSAQAREALMRSGRNTAPRPRSAASRALLDAVALVNSGIAVDYPELGFDRHAYFDVAR